MAKTRKVMPALALALAAGIMGCSDLSETFAKKMRPLNVITYVSTDRKVVRKQAYFGDAQSNVVVLTDDAQDGLLPFGDHDGLVDRASLEIFNRGLLFDVIISRGIVYQDHLVVQKEKSLNGIDRDVVKILTDKFVKQSYYLKSASVKTEYEITLKDIRSKDAEVLIDVDGVEERLKRGDMKQVGRVYMMLDKVKAFETDSGFAVLRIGNQGILLKTGQKTRVSITPGEEKGARNKFAKEERIHFEFVVDDTVPTPASAKLEDIFHTFLVDRPGNEHVSFYRIVRDMGDTQPLMSQSVSTFRVVEDPFHDVPEGGFIAGFSGHVKDTVKEVMRFFYGN